MDHIKEQLNALLDTLNFGEGKEDFINKFLLIVNSEVVLELVAKFNHHRVKVYKLNMFCLASLHIQAILNHKNKK